MRRLRFENANKYCLWRGGCPARFEVAIGHPGGHATQERQRCPGYWEPLPDEQGRGEVSQSRKIM